jgi:hypothetical protein
MKSSDIEGSHLLPVYLKVVLCGPDPEIKSGLGTPRLLDTEGNNFGSIIMLIFRCIRAQQSFTYTFLQKIIISTHTFFRSLFEQNINNFINCVNLKDTPPPPKWFLLSQLRSLSPHPASCSGGRGGGVDRQGGTAVTGRC